MTESLDIETVISRVVAVLQSGLNTKIAAINSAKNDSVTLRTFAAPVTENLMADPPVYASPGAYSVLSTDPTVMNFNPFLFVGAQMPGAQALGPFTSVDLEIDLVTVLYTEGGDANMWKRMLRYQRALKEVMQENWNDLEIPGNLYVENLEPRPLEELGDKPYMGVGIRLKTSIA